MIIRDIIIADIKSKTKKPGDTWSYNEFLNLLTKIYDENALKEEVKKLIDDGYLIYTKKTYTHGEFRPTPKFFDTF